MKKILALILALAMCLALTACGGSGSKDEQPKDDAPAANATEPAESGEEAEEPSDEAGEEAEQTGDVKRITFGTAGTAGALYPMGVAMAQTITDHVDGITATGEATAASIENLRNLHAGNTEIAISQTEVASFAYNGQSDYEGSAFTDIRAMFASIDNFLQVFVLADSDIQSIADLKGKTVSMGAAGSGGEMAARTALLPSYGLSYDDITPQFMGDADGATALKDGKIDALVVTNPINSATLTELTTSTDVRILPIDADAFYEAYPAYVKYDLPGGTYPGNDEDVTIPRSRIIVCTSTNSGLTDDEVYEITKAIWENRDEWAGCHKSVESQCTWENVLVGIDIPMAPGSIRYLEEKGVEIPDSLKAD